jgi:hypothetical protein
MYFMLGDNRDDSADSRYIGFVPRRNILGRATRVVVSLDPDRYELPRRGRFWRSLYSRLPWDRTMRSQVLLQSRHYFQARVRSSSNAATIN